MGVDRWTREQALGLAPDVASAKAGVKLGVPASWSSTGATVTAVWGECQGSGSRPYQTIVELAEPAYKCSCPSRKFPCKHALGLLILWADGAIPDADAPADFAAEWLASRGARREQAAHRSTEPREPGRATRTVAQRAEAVAGGVAELKLWLTDQVHSGLAGFDGTAYERVDPLARRLVDAKAPGLATRVGKLPAAVVGAGWPDRLLRELGLLWLLAEAHDRADVIPEPLAAAVRRHIGYSVASADVLAGPASTDNWTVLGRTESEEDRITTRTTWLRGSATARWAMLLDFKAPGSPPLPLRPPVGATAQASLAFYPDGLRALPTGDLVPAAPLGPAAPSGYAVARAERSTACAQDPWRTAHPVLVTGRPAASDVPHLVDDDGLAVPLEMADDAWWLLLAASGGNPVMLTGLLGPSVLTPLSVIADGEVIAL